MAEMADHENSDDNNKATIRTTLRQPWSKALTISNGRPERILNSEVILRNLLFLEAPWYHFRWMQ